MIHGIDDKTFDIYYNILFPYYVVIMTIAAFVHSMHLNFETNFLIETTHKSSTEDVAGPTFFGHLPSISESKIDTIAM